MINFFDNDMREIWASRDSGSTFPISRVYFESIQVWPSTPPTPVVTYYFNISPTAITVDGTSQNFTITATTDSPLWEIVSTPSWLTFSGATQIGDNEYSLVFSAENNTGDTRQDFVTFRYQSNSRGAKAFVVMGVTQEEGQPCNEIWYISTNGAVVQPTMTGSTYYGASIVSNTYVDGQGVILFDNCVTMIGRSAFYSCTNLSSIVIPSGVTWILDYAFQNCTSLSLVTIPDSVTSIGIDAFRNCTSLSLVTIPDSVTMIRERAFSGCTNLSSVTIGSGVTYIGGAAFYKCYALSSITIPDSVTLIANNAFQNCTSLSSVTIGSGVTEIREYVFDGCTSLSSISYNNTKAQWASVTKGSYWHRNVPATVVHCTDGDRPI